DATRYLCAAVQLDHELAKQAIESVFDEPHRAVASSPGVDLVCVLRYALAARSRQVTAKVLLTLIAIGLVASFVYQLGRTAPATGSYGPSLGLPPFTLPLLVLAWAVILIERLTAYYGVVRPRLSRSAFDPAQAPRAARPQDEARLGALAGQDHHGNVTVFSGYEPFIGYGRLIDSWNFTIPVDRPSEQADAVLPFSLAELATEVTGAVEALGLPGVEISERVFVSGADLAQGLNPTLRRLLLPRPDERPQVSLPPAVLDQLREDGSGRARPYLVTTVSGWGSEVVITTTVRFSLSPAKDALFVEGAALLLPPIDRRHHLVDHLLDRPTWRQLLAHAGRSLTAAPGQLVRCAFAVIAFPVNLLINADKRHEQLRQIAKSEFNYGARMSIRQTAAESKFHRYYQQIDREMYAKIVERRILDTLIDFLENHRVDVSELRERRSVIYNGGIFTSGNSRINFVNSSVAAGAGSRIRTLIGRGGTDRQKEKQ
ncbi:hypothetical protein, partial [Streptomyces sp. FH025]|uniref:hypothetical protein n=1 Tax=Streptomyces sp. FH025 TaxID=2815937 RepID=UPI001A9EAB89